MLTHCYMFLCLASAHLAAEGVNTGDLSSDEDFDTFDAEFSAHKREYYMTKMEYETVTPWVTFCLLICWVLHENVCF